MTSQRVRLTRLLDRGFYPLELPPCFKTRNFANVRTSLTPSNNYAGSTTFFDGATYRGHLRTFGVINPLNYILLSRFIAQNWSDIVEVFRLSQSSGARPKFPSLGADGRAIETATLASKRRSQRHLASAYPVILSLDINRYYGSIYTHSIPWAALGKEEAKRRFRARTLSGHWSDRLDQLVRNCNQQQTVGIPIGPDTSRIVSEIILSRIDYELSQNGSGIRNSQIYHNIDDYQFGCNGAADADDSQSRFVRTISRYELRLNDFKTSVDQGVSFSPSNFQRYFDTLSSQSRSNFVEHFFEILYAQVQLHPNSNVIGYALKRFARRLAGSTERDLLREYLQRLIFAVPHQARWILPLLVGIYRIVGVNTEIRRLIGWGIETCARRNDVGSLLWYLYAAIFLRVRVAATHVGHCLATSNELVDLVLYHGRAEGLFSIDLNELRQRYRSSAFDSSAWLTLYEVERRGWDTSASFAKIGTADDISGLYQHLRTQNVEFYVTDQGRFEVEAFDGWRLTQQSFQESQPEPDEHIDFAYEIGGWTNDIDENYG